MRVADLERLYDFNHWANRKLFEVISGITPEEFTKAVAGSYGSIRNTLVHMLSAEWGWLDRCGGPARGQRLDPADYPSVESVIELDTRVEGYARGFLANLQDADLDRDIQFSLGSLEKHSRKLGDLLHHGVIHEVHHRGQVAILLRMLGHTPGNFDFLVYSGDAK